MRDRLAGALVRLWPDAQEVFAPLAGEEELVRGGFLAEPLRALHLSWQEAVRAHSRADHRQASAGGAHARRPHARTDDFAWLHGQFTMVARSEEGATW